jgi:heat shock protein HtpX
VKNLYEQQASNRRRTWIVMAAFVGFLAFLGAGFDTFYLGLGFDSGVPLPLGTVTALAVGSVSSVVSYYKGDRAVLAASGARPLDALRGSASDDTEAFKLRQLENVVDEMTIASGLPRPKLYVVPDTDSNAFATGRDPDHASIAVTRGLLDRLSRDELQGVIAHEMSHIRNYDIRLMTIVAALVGAVALLSDWARHGMRLGGGGSGRSSRDRKGGGGALGLMLVLLWLFAIMLAPVIGHLLATMVSRRREYLADASGAELTRNPLGLASALKKIELDVEPTRAIKRGSAHLCIADPLGRKMGLREGFWADLLATHPPMSKRVAALHEMAFQAQRPGAN